MGIPCDCPSITVSLDVGCSFPPISSQRPGNGVPLIFASLKKILVSDRGLLEISRGMTAFMVSIALPAAPLCQTSGGNP